MTNYSREDLIDICERAFVPQLAWTNRDSSDTQRQLGECYALLRAGCDFTTERADETIWVYITHKGFDAFEYGGENSLSVDSFYLPTNTRLDRRGGGDWY